MPLNFGSSFGPLNLLLSIFKLLEIIIATQVLKMPKNFPSYIFIAPFFIIKGKQIFINSMFLTF